MSNLIVVRPRFTPDPEELKSRIERALVRSVETDAERIRVDVHGDKIVLQGTVRSWAEREEAERVAWSAPGIRSVENRITIEV